MSKQNEGGTPTKKKHLNEGLDLGQFDYGNMQGAMYDKYIDYVQGKIIDEDDPHERRSGGLNANKQYVFEVYNVRPLQKRLVPKSLTDKTMIPNGFELRESKPRQVTTTYLKDALLLNTALYAKIAGDNNNPIFYYVLQKPTTEK